jgi:hypothetical protein
MSNWPGSNKKCINCRKLKTWEYKLMFCYAHMCARAHTQNYFNLATDSLEMLIVTYLKKIDLRLDV